MRLVRVSGAGTGLVVDVAGVPQVVDPVLAAARLGGSLGTALAVLFPSEQASWRPLAAQWSASRGAIEDLLGEAQVDLERGVGWLGARPLDSLVLDPPLADPNPRTFAMGGNFAQHSAKVATQIDVADSVAAGGSDGAPPWGFFVIPGSVVGDGATVTPPEGTTKLDYEAEVAVVLGGGEHLPGSDEVDIWGYTAWNDFSVRDEALGLARIDHGPLTWSLTKNFRTGHACGPWLMVGEPDVSDLSIRCLVDGELRQHGSTAEMTHSFGAIAAHLSKYVALGAGDVIVSGTPGGTAIEGGIGGPFLKDGSQVEVLVDGIAPLRNQIKAS